MVLPHRIRLIIDPEKNADVDVFAGTVTISFVGFFSKSDTVSMDLR